MQFFQKPEILDTLELNSASVSSPQTLRESAQVDPSQVTDQTVDNSLDELDEFIRGFKDPLIVGFNIKSKVEALALKLDDIKVIDLTFLTQNTNIDIQNINDIMIYIKNRLDMG